MTPSLTIVTKGMRSQLLKAPENIGDTKVGVELKGEEVREKCSNYLQRTMVRTKKKGLYLVVELG